jgi:hypothetical protein
MWRRHVIASDGVGARRRRFLHIVRHRYGGYHWARDNPPQQGG